MKPGRRHAKHSKANCKGKFSRYSYLTIWKNIRKESLLFPWPYCSGRKYAVSSSAVLWKSGTVHPFCGQLYGFPACMSICPAIKPLIFYAGRFYKTIGRKWNDHDSVHLVGHFESILLFSEIGMGSSSRLTTCPIWIENHHSLSNSTHLVCLEISWFSLQPSN